MMQILPRETVSPSLSARACHSRVTGCCVFRALAGSCWPCLSCKHWYGAAQVVVMSKVQPFPPLRQVDYNRDG